MEQGWDDRRLVSGPITDSSHTSAPAGMHDVFLCHTGRDQPVVERIADRLRRHGVVPWLDRWSLIAGEAWQPALERAIEHSRSCAVFVGPGDLGAWELQEAALALDRAAKDRDFRVFAVLLPGVDDPIDSTKLPAFLRLRTWVDFRRGEDSARAMTELVAAAKGLAPGSTTPVEPLLGVTPYRGLQPFREEDARFFFGRDREVQRLLELLKSSRFLAVVGSSGSGKSSLVRAGLVPALRGGALPDASRWRVRVLRPGADPLGTLAAHLVALHPGPSMHATLAALRERPATMHLASHLAVVDELEDTRLLWVVDQLEEVFTLTTDEKDRAAFIDNLLVAAAAVGGPCSVVTTMRADFYAHADAYPELAEQVGAHQFVVRPMEREALRDVIRQPAHLAGAELESGLVDTILDDVADEPNALPLLEHALLELWERRRGTTLTLEGYRESGGVRGALTARAEEIYGALDEQQKRVARGVLLRLTQPGETTEDTRRKATLDELITERGDRAAVEEVVGRLAAVRLLTVSGDDGGPRTVEVSHEALIRGWARLREWIDEDRAGLRVHRRLGQAASEWGARERDESLQYSGLLLDEVVAWQRRSEAELNPLEREFVDASLARRDRERRAQRLRRRITIGALVAVIVVVGSLAVWAARQADAAREERDLAVSRQLASDATTQLANDPELSVLLAQTALARRSTPEANTALRDALAQDRLLGTFAGHTNQVFAARFDRSGRRLVTTGADGTVQIWDTVTRRRIRKLEHDPSGADLVRDTEDVQFSSDGERLVAVGNHARVWSAATGALLHTMGALDPESLESSFTNGDEVVVMDDSGSAAVYDAETGRWITRLEGTEAVGFGNASLSPDGRWFAAKIDEEPARLWNARTGRVVRELAPMERSGSLWDGGSFAFSPDSRLLLVSSDRPTRLFRMDDGAVVRTYPRAGHVGVSAFSGDSKRFVTGREREASVWGVDSGAQIGDAQGTDGIFDAALSHDGRLMVTAGDDGVGEIWEAATGRSLGQLRGHGGRLLGAWFSPEAKSVVTVGFDGDARLWRTHLGRRPATLHTDGTPFALAFSPDGRALVAGGEDGVARIWRAKGKPLELPLGGEIFDVGFRDNGRLVVATDVGAGSLWDARTGELVTDLTDKAPPDVSELEVSPDGEMLLSLATGAVTATPLRGGGRERKLPIRGDTYEAMAQFSGDSRLAIIADTEAATVWDPRRGRVVARRPQSELSHAELSRDGRLAATVADFETIEVWSTATKDVRARVTGDGGSVREVVFSPAGDKFVGSFEDGAAQVWSIDGRRLYPLPGVEGNVVFSADGRWLAAVTGDGARIWEARTGHIALDLVHPAAKPAEPIAISPDGHFVATAGQDGAVQIQECEICQPVPELLRIAKERVTRSLTDSERRRFIHD